MSRLRHLLRFAVFVVAGDPHKFPREVQAARITYVGSEQ